MSIFTWVYPSLEALIKSYKNGRSKTILYSILLIAVSLTIVVIGSILNTWITSPPDTLTAAVSVIGGGGGAGTTTAGCAGGSGGIVNIGSIPLEHKKYQVIVGNGGSI